VEALITIKEIVREGGYIWMKISGKIYMHIIYTFFNENSSVLHSSLNPRPELLASMNDDLSVKVSHYI
jgi:hypothetical protein